MKKIKNVTATLKFDDGTEATVDYSERKKINVTLSSGKQAVIELIHGQQMHSTSHYGKLSKKEEEELYVIENFFE